MATHDDEAGGSRLWRGMRHLIFGEDSEPSLRDQIEEAIEEAEDSSPIAGDLSPPERQMLRNLLHFGDQTAGEIAVTRGDIVAVPSDIDFDELVQAFSDAGHSRLPVYGESLDEVVGMVHIKDVFMASVDRSRDRSLTALMREPLFVPESMGVIELLALMRSQRIHLAVVVDEFGGTEGLVTIEDVVEEIVGDIEDEHDAIRRGVLRREDGSLISQGDVPIRDLNREFGWELPEDVAITIAGLVLHEARRIPEVGQIYAFYGFRFEILKREGTRIAELRIVPPAAIQAAK